MKAATSRTRIAEQGLRTLSKDGLAGVTIGRIADASGLSKSGMFAHFRSRQALEIALLDEAARVADLHVVAPAMREPEGLPRLLALVHRWLGWSANAELPGGCPIAAALFELDDAEGPVRDHVATLENRWRTLLAGLVEAAKVKGELAVSTDVDQVVWELCGIYLTHHSSYRFHRDPDSDRRARTAIEALIERYRPRQALAPTEVPN